jgi:hypothetical protein
MAHEYKILHGSDQEILSKWVNEHLAIGWDLWGNPFAAGLYTFNQAVVRMAQEPASETHAAEAAGFTTQVPETPAEEQDGPTVVVPILPEMADQPANWLKQHIEFGNQPGSCACFEKVGDNPQCHLHGGGPFSHGGLAS